MYPRSLIPNTNTGLRSSLQHLNIKSFNLSFEFLVFMLLCPDIGIIVQAISVEGQRTSLQTNYILKVFDLALVIYLFF